MAPITHSEMRRGWPRPGGVSARLWDDTQPEYNDSLYNPFVLAMAQGILPRSSFQHYVAQDAHFLQFFGRAYAMALSKCGEEDDEVFGALSTLLRGVTKELKLHNEYARSWGVYLEDVTPSKATVAYTDFLMETCESAKGVAEILAAMAPCARLYGFLGCQLAAAYPGMDHAYADWTRQYSSDDYLGAPDIKEKMLDSLAERSDYGTLLRLYRQAMQLEADFFSAQPHLPPPRVFSLLVCDFDDTCSQQDSSSALLSAITRAAAEALPSEPERAAALARHQAQVAAMAANYVEQQRVLLDRLLPPQSESGAGPSSAGADMGSSAGADMSSCGLDWAGLQAFLEQLSDFDIRMNDVVEEAGVLAGISPSQLAAAGRSVTLQPGCAEVLRRAAASGLPLHLLTLNWSDAYVTGALEPAGLQLQTADNAIWPSCGPSPSPRLLSNALEMEAAPSGALLSTGRLLRQVQNARDKGRAFQAMLGHVRQAQAQAQGGRSGATVYVGDSISDLLPLLQADVGIVVGSSGTLRRVARAYGVQLKPLCAAPWELPAAAADPSAPPRGVLYEAASWHEIHSFLFGPRNYFRQQQAEGAAAADATAAGAAPWVPRVLTVAGSDSGGGAGIQADLKTMQACGVFGMSAVTALTAQNTHGVQGVHCPPPAFLAQQLDSVLGDIGADAVKTGMLPSAEHVEVVAHKVREHGVCRLVVDPVMVSTSGHELAGSSVAQALRRHLLPLATLVTPNLPEAAALLGCPPITDLAGMEAAAQALHEACGCQAVLIKGGHLALQQQQQQQGQGQGQGQGRCREVVDVLYDGRELTHFSAPCIQTSNAHGTGCTLASAIASELALGLPLAPAISAARAYLLGALQASAPLAIGKGVQRPFNHGYRHADWASSPAHAARWAPPRMAAALRLYTVTDPGCNKKTGRSLLQAVEEAVAGGATIVQIREKDCEGGAFLEQARGVLQLCRSAGVPLVINDRVDVALALGPDVGVHVGQGDLPCAEVRRLLGPGRVLGVSVKTEAEARRAQAQGADYLGCGAVYPTGTKDSSIIGLAGLAQVCASVSLPVVAIGGVGLANTAECVAQAGCAGVAVVSAIFAQADARGAARALREEVERGLRTRAGGAAAAGAQ